ncbi:MAG: cupin domain-containing protein [Desulfobacteraceae bacterium]|nr:cupin domain-containing protein [Desulfobacteraceae bacterium]
MMLTQFTIQKNSAVPMHSHPHEQIGYLASGRLELTVEKKAFIANAGDSWCIPADAEHSAIGIETCVVIEVFSPVRKEYLPENK